MASSPSSLLTRVDRYISEQNLLASGQRVVVGVSGGIDSVVLAHLLHRLGYDLVVAHVNYGLRAAADNDAAFVRQWAASLDPPVPVYVTSCDPEERAAADSTSVQAAARAQRYAFMAECAAVAGTDRVAVAHHRDDQAETLLLNLFRGSGVEGLAGMPPQRPMVDDPSVMLVRPLLDVPRAAIEACAREERLSWREDASNASLDYDRNVLRHRVLPVIEEHFEGATGRMAQSAAHVQAYLEDTFRPVLEERFARCAASTARGGRLALDALRQEPPVWRRRLVLEALRRWLDDAPYTSEVAHAVEALLDVQVGRRVDFAAGIVWRERDALQVVRADAVPPPIDPTPVSLEEPVPVPTGTLRVNRVNAVPDDLGAGAPNVVYADADACTGGFTVRLWETGDRFQPLGMAHTKAVSDFLTDEQVPPHRRAEVLVLCDATRIVWVVGHRLAHPARIRPSTEHALRFAFVPASAENG